MKYIFLLISLLMLGMNFYVIYRLVHILPRIMLLRSIVLVIGIFAVVCLFCNFLVGDRLSLDVSSWIYKIGTSWLFVSFYFFMIFLLLDILRITHLLPVGQFINQSWVGLGSIVGVVFIAFLYGNIKYHNKARVELNVVSTKTNPSAPPLKIVAVSDMHLGYNIRNEEFAKWIELINQENPDIVLIAGDIIDNSIRPVREMRMEQQFKTIRSKYGIYACLGNHEYISGASESEAFLKDAGIHLLKDQSALIDNRFYVVGRNDRSNPNRETDLSRLIDTLDQSKPIILLDHQPYELEQAENNNIDLQISGHTHKGQIWPISWITQSIYEIAHGYLKKGNSHIYVSSGIGLWGGKFRIGSQSEYVVINLSLSE